MNNLKKFNFSGSDVRVEVKNGEIWFNLKDVCDTLDIKNSSDKLKLLKNSQKDTLDSIDAIGRKKEMSIISETGLYKILLTTRRNDKTEKFQDWIAEEVLPQIRKTGKYEVKQTLEQRSLVIVSELLDKVNEQKKSLERMEPKEIYYDKIIAQPEKTYSMGTVAKLLGTGRNKLFKFLRENNIIMNNNEPYQTHLNNRRFIIKDKIVNDRLTVPVTLATQKGLDFILKLKGAHNQLV